MLIRAVVMCVALASMPGLAWAGCPPDTYQTGEEREQVGDTIIVHPVCDYYTPSGNALIGGVTWNLGAYLPGDASPELGAHMRQMVHDQALAAGIPYDAAIDFGRYNFVLGIAASTHAFQDIISRAGRDQVALGQFSAEHQAAYASLRGRQFEELGCHSNGAMICLAAIMNRDVQVRNVVLYGPQLTATSIYLWDQLVREGRIGSVRVLMNENDPVTATALLSTNPAGAAAALAAPFLSAPLFFNQNLTANLIRTVGPSLHVQTFPCSESSAPSLACHDMGLYRTNRGCAPATPGPPVPGTNIPGRGGAAEPPPPC